MKKYVWSAAILLSLIPSLLFGKQPSFEFSVFTDLNVAAIVDGESIGQKLKIPELPSVLSSETVFFVTQSPEQVAKFLSSWNPIKHENLGVIQHEIFSSSATLENFSSLKLDSSRSTHEWLIDATHQNSDDLNLNKKERRKINGKGNDANSVRDFWREILFNRTQDFQRGGVKETLSYTQSDTNFSLSEKLSVLWKQLDRIQKNFKPVLAKLERNEGDVATTFYWEEMKVEKEAVFNLGAIASHQQDEAWYVGDMQYYVSCNYDASLTLYCIKAVNQDGKKGSLIWRGDYVFSNQVEGMKGIERVFTEKLFLQDIKKTNEAIRSDLSK